MLYIFDFDGTLVDSVDSIVTAMQAAIADVTLPERSHSQVSNIIGLGLSEALQTLFPGIKDKLAKQTAERYSYHFINSDTDLVLFEGVEAVLQNLTAAGHSLSIATGKSRRGLDRVFGYSSLKQYFPYSRCADETRSKPHPLMLNELLTETGIEASDAVMIGDTTYDIKMAVNAGVKSIGVSYGVHSSEQLMEAGAERVIDRFDELLGLQLLAI
ncbi:MAG: phosphoglycolate phosphatase [Pseudomonadales bacterium]|jgi:phosphoglycolate phosphatase